MSLPARGTTAVTVSWDGSGDFDGEFDDTTADVQREPAIVIEIGRDAARALGRPRANLATWRYRNQDRLYSADYSGSPLRGDLKPGRPARIEKTIGADTTTMADATATMADAEVLMSGVSTARLFTGQTDEPKELYGPGPRKRWVGMRALGALAKLQAADSVTIGLQTNITTGAAFVLVFQAAGLAADEYVVDQEMIDNGRRLSWWYVDRRKPFEVAQELWATEGPTGAFYEDQFGRAIVEGSTYLFLTERCNTVQQTFYASAADGLAFVGLEPVPGWRQIVNDAVFPIELRKVGATQVVAEYNGSLALSASESKTVILRANDPLSAITTPALTTDYTVTGTALAGVTAVQLGALAVAITFTAGAGSATVGPPVGGNGPQLRGQPLTLISTIEVEPTVDASASQAEYGVRSLPEALRPWPGTDPDDAAGVADAWITAYQDNRPSYLLTIVNTTGLLNWETVGRKVSDLIHVTDDAESGADLDLTIHSIRHEIAGDHYHRVTFGCEKRIEQDWGLWDVARFDVDRFGQ